MITMEAKGDFNNIEKFLATMEKGGLYRQLEGYAQRGVSALAAATPKRSGLAASSWGYKIEVTNRGCSITWTNDNIENGFPVAVMLQYGHGTGTGGYVRGVDYINPAIRPIFDEIADEVWKGVTSA